MFFSSVERERTKEFDRAIQAARLVVDGDHVGRTLGNLGLQLDEAISSAFLPNVRHSQVIIPRLQRNRNGTAVVPRLMMDNVLHLDLGMLAPTPRRLEKMAGQLGRKENPEQALAHLLSQVSGQQKSSDHALPRGWDFPYATYTYTHQAGDVYFSSRPLVTYDVEISQVQGKTRTGLGVLHEFTHAVDAENQLADPEAPLKSAAWLELRAYRVSAVAATSCVERGLVPAQSLPSCGVEELRTQYGIDSDALLSGELRPEMIPGELVQQLDEGGILSFEKRQPLA